MSTGVLAHGIISLFFFLIAVNLMWDKLNPINNYLPFNIFGINKQKASTKHIIYFPKISLLF